ncbi:MAG TPA: AAA family ATPase [Bryobacteraceae bacterium]|jgi:predicted ATPase|nr:AAA family ATPase [Bryobacteraceae bacterium]
MVDKLTIEGFKSIRELRDFELRPLNVLIGANGAGKSNFVGFCRLLRELVEQRLQVTINTEGGADACLYMGPKITKQFAAKIAFDGSGYEFALMPTADNELVFVEEMIVSHDPLQSRRFLLGQKEATLKDRKADHPAAYLLFSAISGLAVYHFHDTSLLAGVRRQGPLNDNEHLRPSAENLAAFLYRIKQTSADSYAQIRDVVRLAAPFFDDFKLRPWPTDTNRIQLEWTQTDSDYLFRAHQLSDGTLRFICLATALLASTTASTIVFDEPELGLHPYALSLLGALFRQAAEGGKQVIISTQSALLVDEFSPEDVIVVERSRGESLFRRLKTAELSEWLDEYSLGELWQKNVLGGRPREESLPQLVSDSDS